MRGATPAEQGVVSHKALLRRKSVLGTDNALVGAEGASSAEFHSVLQIQHNTVVGRHGGRSTLGRSTLRPYRQTDCFFPFKRHHVLWPYSE